MLLLGAAAVYLASVLLGFTNAATVQPVIDVERTVFYRCTLSAACTGLRCQRFLHACVAVRVGQTISCPCRLWSGLSLSIVMLPFRCLLPPIRRLMTAS